jgi:hyperosmotically inducible periplasmic protein
MKTSHRLLHASVALGVVLSLTNPLLVSRAAAQATSSQPDNSAQNKAQSTTADNQSNAQADRTTAAQVRKAIIADKDLSTYAHNVKIIVANGTVTLKGPVKSDDEKQKVVAVVASVVPADKVTNELTVKQ